MGSREKYKLQLIDFKETIISNWQKLRNEDKFCDVTLICDDGTKVKAHKVILCSVSSVFENMLSNENPHQPILLYLRGVKYSQIVYLLDFIYKGEINICQSELEDFILVAKDLKIKGITDEDDAEKESNELSNDLEDLSSDSCSHPFKKKRRGDIHEDNIEIKDMVACNEPAVENNLVSCEKSSAEIDGNNENDFNNANKGFNVIKPHPFKKEDPTNIDIKNNVSYEDKIKTEVFDAGKIKKDFFDEGKMKNKFSDGNKFKKENTSAHACDRCNYQTIIKGHLTQHIKSIHEGVRYPCESCDYKATTKSALNNHVKAIHEGIKYNCQECDLQTSNKHYLVQHVSRMHDATLYSCNECGETITGKYKFDQHMKTKHTQ